MTKSGIDNLTEDRDRLIKRINALHKEISGYESQVKTIDKLLLEARENEGIQKQICQTDNISKDLQRTDDICRKIKH